LEKLADLARRKVRLSVVLAAAAWEESSIPN
jgi:hypothetical protein